MDPVVSTQHSFALDIGLALVYEPWILLATCTHKEEGIQVETVLL